MNNFNIMGVHGKIRFLGGGGVHEKPKFKEGFPKKGGLDSLNI